MAVRLEIAERSLSGAPAAHSLIRRIATHLHVHKDKSILLDLTHVELISQDFAERTFGPLTAAFGKECVLRRLRVSGADDAMIRLIAEAICRGAAPTYSVGAGNSTALQRMRLIAGEPKRSQSPSTSAADTPGSSQIDRS